MSEWISVEERLPREIEPVLVYSADRWSRDVWVGCLCCGAWISEYEEIHVTHWTPLPEPPHD